MPVKRTLIALLAAGIALTAAFWLKSCLKTRFERKVREKTRGLLSFETLEIRPGGLFLPRFRTGAGVSGSGLWVRPDDLSLFIRGKSGRFSFEAESLLLMGVSVEKAEGTWDRDGRTDLRCRVRSLNGTLAFRGVLSRKGGAFTASGRLSSDSLSAAGIPIRSVECEVNAAPSASGGTADFSLIAFEVAGGRAEGRGFLRNTGGVLDYSFDMEYRDIDLNRLGRKLQGVSFSGRFSGGSRVKGRAKDFRELLGRLASVE